MKFPVRLSLFSEIKNRKYERVMRYGTSAKNKYNSICENCDRERQTNAGTLSVHTFM